MNDEKLKPAQIWNWLLIGAAGVAIVCAVIGLLPLSNVFKDHWGNFEGSFGAVSALFTGLAFIAAGVSVYLLKDTNDMQRRELEATREVMMEQTRHIRWQNFEATFFRMLESFHGIIAGLSVTDAQGNTLTGRNVLSKAANKIWIDSTGSYVSFTEKSDLINKIKNISEYDEFYYESEDYWSPYTFHYFRALYIILLYVHESSISRQEKKRYTRVIRSALSSDECLLEYLNGRSRFGAPKMKPLIEEYALLKHLPAKYVEEAPFVCLEYNLSAFGEGSPAAEAAARVHAEHEARQSASTEGAS